MDSFPDEKVSSHRISTRYILSDSESHLHIHLLAAAIRIRISLQLRSRHSNQFMWKAQLEQVEMHMPGGGA